MITRITGYRLFLYNLMVITFSRRISDGNQNEMLALARTVVEKVVRKTPLKQLVIAIKEDVLQEKRQNRYIYF